MQKYIFVTGGAVSDYAKTTVASSIGLLLSARGFGVEFKKLNPCLNIDLGSLNPALCGESFVTADGGETDSSFGFYERFTGIKQSKYSCMTAGNIYWSVINKERMGSFMGDRATVSSHVADEVKKFVFSATSGDVVIVELGGTVGDVESIHFLDAIGKVKEDVADENIMYLHVENIPHHVETEEEKLVPIGRSISSLLERGIKPDAIICRTEESMQDSLKDKVSIFTNVDKAAVIESPRTDIIYETPFILDKSGLWTAIMKKLSLQDFKLKLDSWKDVISKMKKAEKEIRIALVGKYTSLRSAYQSVKEALDCAGAVNDVKVLVDWIEASSVTEKNVEELLKGANGIILPDGKGRKDVQGMILAAKFARENDIPFLAIGQGMHMAVVEVASSVLGLKDAHSTEAWASPYPVVTEADGYVGEKKIKILRRTKSFSAYGRELFSERCRHKYIVSDAYREKLEEAGMYFVGKSADDEKCEIVEMLEKRFYVGVQFNPEFSSYPSKVHPLFEEFIREARK